MTRLRLRSDTSEPSMPRGYVTKMFLIVGIAVGAAVLTASHPEIGLPLNVALAVLGNLFIVTKDSRRSVREEEENRP